MPTYTVYLNQVASLAIRVEAEDREAAIEQAYEEIPGGLCAQCSGWGQKWSLDFGGEWQTADESFSVGGVPLEEAVIEETDR